MERLIIYRCGDRKLNCPACPKCGDCSGNADCVEVLMEQLAAYEDSGLAPEDIPTGLELANVFCALNELKKYEALGTLDELKALQEKVKQEQPNEQLTCEGCAYQKREAWNYESCIRCKRHWEDCFKHKSMLEG